MMPVHKQIDVVSVPGIRRVKLWIGNNYLQVELGYFPNKSGKSRLTHAKRVYTDAGVDAIFDLLRDLADIQGGGKIKLPVWKLGETVPGWRA